jgi:tetratricopeptide (TPR) repeat protein
VNALKSLNKEQWTALIAVTIGVISVAVSLTGGVGAGNEPPPAAADRPWEPYPSRFAEFPDEKFERYSVGKLFEAQGASKLPIPPLKAPEPREEDLAAPPFRPGPVTEAYNKLQTKAAKYPTIAAGQAVVPETDLPPQSLIDELKKLEEPQPPKVVDRRGEREVEFFTIILKIGGKPKLGELLIERDAEIHMINKDTKSREVYKKDQIEKVIYNRTNEDTYRLQSQKIQPGPKEAEERVKLARKLVGWGMMKEAREELALAIKAKKDSADAIAFLAQLLYDAADFDGAITVCEAGLQAQAPPGDLYFEIGRSLRALAFPEGAIGAFERAIENQPRHQGARLALARTLLEAGMHVQALSAANDFQTKVASASDTTPAQKAEGFTLRGIAELRGGDLSAARSDFDLALKIEPQNGEAQNGAGVAFAVDGAYREAGTRFAEAIKSNQYVGEAWTNLGTLLLLGGKAADADAIFKQAAERDPVSVEPVLGQALAGVVLGKKEAAALVDRAVQMDPHHVAARLSLGFIKLRDGADDEALAQFTAALRADTAYLPAFSGAATAYLRTARKLAAEASTTRDESRAAAISRIAEERRVNAETLLKQVRDFDTNRAGSWIALGCAYAVMGRADEARSALRAAAGLLQGAGKADPLIFYTLGYVEYYYAPLLTVEERLESAEREFAMGAKLEGTLTDPFSVRVIADCKLAAADIETWRVTSLRLDERFERPTAKSVGGGWLEAEDKYGISISLENTKERGGRAKFAGKQSIAAYGLTCMTHEIPAENFYVFEGTIYPEQTAKTEYGFSIFYAKQGDSWVGFHIGMDGQGKVRYNVAASDPRDLDRRDFTSGGWMESKVVLPNPKEVTIRIVRGEKNRLPTFTIFFWDTAKNEWILANRDITVNIGHPKGNWKVGVFCRADQGADVLFTVDNIRVFERTPR